MTSKEFKEDLKNPKKVYCLVSTDSEMIDLYVDRFKKAINATYISYGQIKATGRLFNRVTLSVLYMPKLTEEVFEQHNYIFIYTDNIDKRTSVYKKYKGQIIELSNDYTDYVMKNSNFNKAQATQFIKTHNNDLGMIKNALTIYNESDFNYDRFTDYSSDIYLWVESFIKKEPLPNIIESPISVMALLSTNCNNLLRIKQNDIIGMNPYIISCMQSLKAFITEEELVEIIGNCFYLDCQIKKGLIDSNYVLDYLILRRYEDAITN